jgi:hypothetical protein
MPHHKEDVYREFPIWPQARRHSTTRTRHAGRNSFASRLQIMKPAPCSRIAVDDTACCPRTRSTSREGRDLDATERGVPGKPSRIESLVIAVAERLHGRGQSPRSRGSAPAGRSRPLAEVIFRVGFWRAAATRPVGRSTSRDRRDAHGRQRARRFAAEHVGGEQHVP